MARAEPAVTALDEFNAQMAIWHWTVWSAEKPRDGVRNPSLVTETPELRNAHNGWWDRRWVDLLDIERWHGTERVDVPQWWALACSADIAIAQGHAG